MSIEDFEEVKRRRDQILVLTADLKVQDRQWVIDCIFEQNRPFEEPQPEPTASEQAQIDAARAVINERL